MKFKVARLSILSILLPLIFCVPAFSQTRSQSKVIELMSPSEIVTGSIPAGRGFNDCTLGETQYRIEFPGGPRRLVINTSSNQFIFTHIRRDSPVTIENGKILSDSQFFFSPISLPAFGQGGVFDGTPLLQPGSYFIALVNCGQSVVDYTLSVKILDPPDAEQVDIPVNNFPGGIVEVGSVPADPGFCRLGRTQYAVRVSLTPCFGTFWSGVIRADQNVNVYIRKDKPVTVENGIVMYDSVTAAQAKIQRISVSLSEPGTALFFIAVENCSFDAANYTVTTIPPPVADIFPPFISRVFFEKKDLHIVGLKLRGGKVFFDNQLQEAIDGGRDSNFNDVLIIKKAKKKIHRRQPVLITVTDFPCGGTAQFLFLRR